ncbi:MAG: sigma-70 family RNA polymerase sigma factor [Acidobacteria bacterium]|nr:sigma-70 family RNA polymerase sigma factor [Acidobacteriota bacterium]
MEQSPGEVTVLLRKAQGGQIDAADQLVRMVYSELRRIAGAFMRGERPGHTLQPSALINEAWLRLADQTQVDWRDRAHFFGVAAQMMRRVLVDHARARLADKRGAGATVVGLDWVEIDSGPRKLEEILAVDEVLDRLLQLDSQQAQIVEMRYFAGMTVKETAEVLRVSTRTVDREFALASAWLRRELAGRGAP